jgi:hypothetical protein
MVEDQVRSELAIIGDFLSWCSLEGYALVRADRVLALEQARVHYERVVNDYADDRHRTGILPFLSHPEDRDE